MMKTLVEIFSPFYADMLAHVPLHVPLHADQHLQMCDSERPTEIEATPYYTPTTRTHFRRCCAVVRIPHRQRVRKNTTLV